MFAFADVISSPPCDIDPIMEKCNQSFHCQKVQQKMI